MLDEVVISYEGDAAFKQAQSYALEFKTDCIIDSKVREGIRFCVTAKGCEIRTENFPQVGALRVDLLEGALAHRRQGSDYSKKELVVRATGLHKRKGLSILDGTAGLGRDAWVLACCGANIVACERHRLIYLLFKDALMRAQSYIQEHDIKLDLINRDALAYIRSCALSDAPDVVLLDPMFSPKTKAALVKKEMRLLRQVVGDDMGSIDLLDQALQFAKQRVVVKRSVDAPLLSERKPDYQVKGSRCRYDIYLR